MRRMLSASTSKGFLLILILLAGARQSAHADLIRAVPGRTFPDIAGDIGGSQTYVYDPATQTGTFALDNAPHLISLGPAAGDLVPMQPNRDGTLYQSLKLKLDGQGRLVDSPLNRFEIRGSVIINNERFEGVLLEGRPTAFGLADPGRSTPGAPEVFGLNMRIEGGKLAEAFGKEAYLRIIPQANSTFSGAFTSDFSGEKPMTNLLALDHRLASAMPVAPALAGLVLATAAILGCTLAWRATRPVPRRVSTRPRPMSRWASPA